jgi:dTDP-4-dehydrorhamnose 3,5-epimerase-like enzyme
VRIHIDRRRTAYCDVFEGLPGDCNVFLLEAHKPSGWHRHRKQTDQFRVIQGTLRFGRWKEKDQVWYATLDRPELELKVLPGWWHGYANEGTEDAWLLMYLDQKYDVNDEERLSEAEQPWLVV